VIRRKAGMLLSVAALIISVITLLNSPVFGDKTPQKGDVLPDINIPVPLGNADKEYLGLEGGGFFQIPQIKARAVIIEIFSMYCPYCQREAPEVNRLYHLIENAGWVVPHETLLAKVWGYEYREEIQYLRLYITYLRQKIEPDPSHPRYILTERGVGYRFIDFRKEQFTRAD